ncbi:MAG TPA: hypothetical protein VN238_05980 [Solirubrobacteraceae bacterium]|nr:hypothetical protein [Solirubrobacteraceae bacterium]
MFRSFVIASVSQKPLSDTRALACPKGIVYVRLRLLLISLSLAVASAAPSVALGDAFEPNDHIDQTWGPVAGGQTYEGVVDTKNDADWFRINLGGQQQIALTVTYPYDDRCFPGRTWYLLDAMGGRIARGDTSSEFRYTTPPSGGVYYFAVNPGQSDQDDAGIGCRYAFSVTPATAVIAADPSAPPRQGAIEPNESAAQAFGPLSAGMLYTGAIETSNDSDWLSFYLLPGRQVRLALTSTNGCLGDAIAARVFRPGAAVGEPLRFTQVWANTRANLDFTTEAAGRYAIQITGDLGCTWQAMLTPADAVGVLPPPPPAPVVVPAPVPEAKPQRLRVESRLSMRRVRGRYRGRLMTSELGCHGGRTVVLRRVGSGKRSFSRTRTRTDGTFVFPRRARLRGRVYAIATERSTATLLCRVGRSRAR